jgi:transposase InsO family protein
MSRAILLRHGARLWFDGDLLEVVQLEANRIALRDTAGRWRTVGITDFLARARPSGNEEQPELAIGPDLAALSEGNRRVVSDRAAHIREVLTGYRSGTPAAARPDEPRANYDPAAPLMARQAAKAQELGVTDRTIRRWISAYVDSGEAGLVDSRAVDGRGSTLDPRWEQACHLILARQVKASTPTAGAVLKLIDAQLDEQYGPGAVPRPSRSTAHRHLARLSKGTNALKGSAKARRSIADRPPAPYGRLRASRPGQYAILDTQDLDVFAMEPVTCRWVPVQLTVIQDLYTRCILGLRLTPVSTKAVDVASVLYQAMVPQPAPDNWPAEAYWAYHGIPNQLVFSEVEHLPGVPICPPETIVVDHGKAFLSAHVIGVCTRMGISIQPAQPKKPTDKPTVERFFRTLREGLIQYLPAYKGPDIYSRGERIEDAAFYYIHELEDIIREWVALVYHRTKHSGLALPDWPRLELSPNEMYEAGVAAAGFLRVPRSPDLVYDFLEVVPRTIQHYGVEVYGLIYTGEALKDHRYEESPYGGELGGKWPIRVNPDDARYVYFQEPTDRSWHRLEWEHAPGLGAPFSAEAARYARRLAAQQGRWPDERHALASLLARWDIGMVADRRERRMAARLAAERSALTLPSPDDPESVVNGLPTVAGLTAGDNPPARPANEPLVEGDDDDPEEIFDEPCSEDFYADAFGIVE